MSMMAISDSYLSSKVTYKIRLSWTIWNSIDTLVLTSHCHQIFHWRIWTTLSNCSQKLSTLGETNCMVAILLKQFQLIGFKITIYFVPQMFFSKKSFYPQYKKFWYTFKLVSLPMIAQAISTCSLTGIRNPSVVSSIIL